MSQFLDSLHSQSSMSPGRAAVHEMQGKKDKDGLHGEREYHAAARKAPKSGVVTLRDGPTVPIAAIELVLDLERRGCDLYRGGDGQLHLIGRGCTGGERAALARHRQ